MKRSKGGANVPTSKDRITAQNEIPRRVRSAALRILRPLARLFIAHGVVFGDAEKLLKQAFYDAGRQEVGQSNPSMSQLSVSTGLHRKDIRRFADQDVTSQVLTHEPTRSVAAALYTRWVTDPILTKRRRPIDLPLRADSPDKPSFDWLARQISTDAHPRSLLEDLKRLQLVQVTDNGDVRVHPDGYVPLLERTEMLMLLGENLADHLETAVGNVVDTGEKHLEQSVFVDGMSAQAIRQIESKARVVWTDVMNKMVQAMKQAGKQEPKSPGQPGQRVRVGMYFYTDLPRVEASKTDPSPKKQAPR